MINTRNGELFDAIANLHW